MYLYHISVSGIRFLYKLLSFRPTSILAGWTIRSLLRNVIYFPEGTLLSNQPIYIYVMYLYHISVSGIRSPNHLLAFFFKGILPDNFLFLNLYLSSLNILTYSKIYIVQGFTMTYYLQKNPLLLLRFLLPSHVIIIYTRFFYAHKLVRYYLFF